MYLINLYEKKLFLKFFDQIKHLNVLDIDALIYSLLFTEIIELYLHF